MRFVSCFALTVALCPFLSAQIPSIAGCAVFPSDNVWNTPIDKLPVDKNSAEYVYSMNQTNKKLHPDFGYGGGYPYDIVSNPTPTITIPFYYGGDPGPYPVSAATTIEGGSDHHAIIINSSTCTLYELFNLQNILGVFQGGSGAIWSLKSNALRPDGLTSGDAAGLPIFPGLIRYDEVVSGRINHAVRVTADHTRDQHIWPARHDASYLSGSQYPPMGQRFRLKSDFDMHTFGPHVQIVLEALKTYGMILADNGTSWHLSGVGDTRWNDTEMHQLTYVLGGDFEAVDESSLMVDPNSAQVRTTTPIPVPPPTPKPGPSPAPNPKPASAPPVNRLVPTGWINIVSHDSGKCIDMAGGVMATQETVPAQQWTCIDHNHTNQLFQFVPVSGGYKIIAQNSGLALQVLGGDTAERGAGIEQWSFENEPFQIWTLVQNKDTSFLIKNKATGYVLDVQGASMNNGARIIQYSITGGFNQEWFFPPAN